MRFPEEWTIHYPLRAGPVDPATGNRKPGEGIEPAVTAGLWQQVNPATSQKEFGVDALRDDGVLLLDPGADIDSECTVSGPDGTSWRVVTHPRIRRRVRGGRTPKYLAVLVRQTTDMKGTV